LAAEGRRSVGAPIEYGLIGLVLIRKVDGLVRARREIDVAQHLATYEAAEKAGLGIKKEHPMLQVAVYDGVEGVNKIIELP
jgi:hypothetical protein